MKKNRGEIPDIFRSDPQEKNDLRYGAGEDTRWLLAIVQSPCHICLRPIFKPGPSPFEITTTQLY